MRYFCTYFDRNYLIKGLALIESLKTKSSSDFRIYVVCMDEYTRVLIDKLQVPEITTIPIHLIEENDLELLSCRDNRSLVEYLWTTTPSIILKIIQSNPEIDILTYVDADLFFYSSPEDLYSELGNKSVLIHEHRFPDHFKAQEQYGIFNVGLLCFRNSPEGLNVLKWWRDRCIEWCYARVEGSKFGDQGYLNDWPQRFSCVLVTKNIGVGVGPWNDDQYDFSENEKNIPTVNKSPIMFYHFHSFTLINPFLHVPTNDPCYSPSLDIFKLLVLPYSTTLFEIIDLIRLVAPDFSYGIFKNNFGLTKDHGFLVRKELSAEIEKLNLPQTAQQLDNDWLLYIGA